MKGETQNGVSKKEDDAAAKSDGEAMARAVLPVACG